MSDEEDIDIERERVRASARRSLLGGRRFRVGHFELLGWLGAGAMGFVYDALDTELQREVALKVLDQDLPVSLRAERSARLLREARALARVSHANVVTVHEVGRDHGHVFLAMEKLVGRSLDEWLAEAPDHDTIVSTLCGVGRGLAAVHAGGLVHRDLKPGNVVVTEDGRGVLVDFGLVRGVEGRSPSALAKTLTRTGVHVGTPAYMAPEQLRGERGSELSDQFSFCVVLFEALTGRRPYVGVNAADLAATMATGEIDEQGLPDRLRPVLRRGLAPEAGDRFPSLDLLLDAIESDHRRIAGRYVLEGPLGSGGSGVVYRALDTRENDLVALKILKKKRDPRPMRKAMDVRHEGLAEVRDVGTTESSVYVAMELVEGATLRDRFGGLSPRAIARVVQHVAEALMALHDAGFVHRDVKPDNILLDGDRVVLVDLDIATDEHAPEIAGTTPYLAPEQARGHAVSPATDQFGLAVTAFESLVGRRPWTGDATTVLAKLAVEPPPRPSELQPSLPRRVDAVLLRALAKRPEDRYPDVRAFARALRAAVSPARWKPVAFAATLGIVAGAFALQPSPHPLDEDGVLACPIFEVEGIPEPNAWLGAAAADLTCRRAGWSLSGRRARTRVPAELLNLSALGGDDFPRLPFDAPDARERTMNEARGSAAWIEGRVEKQGWELQVTLQLRSGEQVLGESRGRDGLLVAAVSEAVDGLEESGALPIEPLDPEVARWVFPHGRGDGAEGWLREAIPLMTPAHGAMEPACERLFTQPGHSPAHIACAQVSDRFTLQTVDTVSRESPPLLAATAIALAPDAPLPEDLITALEAARDEVEGGHAKATLAAAEALIHRRLGDAETARSLWVTAVSHAPRSHWMRAELVRQSVGNASLTSMVNTRQAWEPAVPFTYVHSAWWGGHEVDDWVMLQGRAHQLARYDAPVSLHAISAMLSAERVDDAQNTAADVAANPAASPTARAVAQAMIDSQSMRVGRAFDRLRTALERVEQLNVAYTGDVVALLALRKLAELMGREREMADAFVDRFVPERLPRHAGAFAMPIAAVCLYASADRAARCLDALEDLPDPPRHDRFAGLDDYLRGARAHANGDSETAIEAWRGLPSTYYFAANLPASIFDEAGEPELGARIDDVKMSRRPYAGLSRAQPSVARRAANRGEVAEARRLAEEVVEKWSLADVPLPGVREMRALLLELERED